MSSPTSCRSRFNQSKKKKKSSTPLTAGDLTSTAPSPPPPVSSDYTARRRPRPPLPRAPRRRPAPSHAAPVGSLHLHNASPDRPTPPPPRAFQKATALSAQAGCQLTAQDQPLDCPSSAGELPVVSATLVVRPVEHRPVSVRSAAGGVQEMLRYAGEVQTSELVSCLLIVVKCRIWSPGSSS